MAEIPNNPPAKRPHPVAGVIQPAPEIRCGRDNTITPATPSKIATSPVPDTASPKAMAEKAAT